MKIAIVSDTHGNVANFKKVVKWLNNLPAQAGNNIKLILHAGDIGSPEDLNESLADFKGELFGVLGNMDKDYRLDLKKYQSEKTQISEEVLETELGGRKIAIVHKPEPAKKLAETGKYDLVFYGHTHRPWEEKVGNCQLINPGELAGQINKPTFAIFDTSTGNLELKILELL